MYRNSNYTQQFAKTPRGPRRELAIDDVSQTSATSTWYYRVNVSVYEEVLLSTFIDEDASSSDNARSSGASLLTTDVEHYSILRRYSDFLQLYEQIRNVLSADKDSMTSLPSFPAKELISPTLKVMLRRTSSSEVVLKDRSAKFEALLQWIENHPIARSCQTFVEFIGKSPQSHDGYVSLKEYTPSDWLSSLQQTTQGMENADVDTPRATRLRNPDENDQSQRYLWGCLASIANTSRLSRTFRPCVGHTILWIGFPYSVAC